MFRDSNRIILVDDNLEDLKQLSKVFIDNGIGCKSLPYDYNYNTPLKGIRIAFFDINLNGAKTDAERNAFLQDAIVKYIHEDNGPYILVLWTSNTTWIDSFFSFVNRDISDELKKRSPYYITNIDKSEFYDPNKKIDDKLKALFNTPMIGLLFDYEIIMSDCIQQTISNLISIIPKDNAWGINNSFEDNCQKILSTIAVQTTGYEQAKNDPDRAIKEAFIPMFSNSFLHSSQNIWKDNLTTLSSSKKVEEVSFPENFKESKLNWLFHIESERSIQKSERGAVCPVMTDVFLDKFDCEYNDWFSRSFPDVTKKERKDSQLISVEFSAACDYYQKKKRTNKYLLGCILPVSAKDKMDESTKKGDFLLLLPYKFEIDNVEKIIAFNLNYSFTIDSSQIAKTIGEPLFCFKKEMMDMIGNKYANHISRIGITSFR